MMTGCTYWVVVVWIWTAFAFLFFYIVVQIENVCHISLIKCFTPRWLVFFFFFFFRWLVFVLALVLSQFFVFAVWWTHFQFACKWFASLWPLVCLPWLEPLVLVYKSLSLFFKWMLTNLTIRCNCPLGSN